MSEAGRGSVNSHMGTNQGVGVPACTANGHANFPVRVWVAPFMAVGSPSAEAWQRYLLPWDILQWQEAHMTGAILEPMGGNMEGSPLCTCDML